MSKRTKSASSEESSSEDSKQEEKKVESKDESESSEDDKKDASESSEEEESDDKKPKGKATAPSKRAPAKKTKKAKTTKKPARKKVKKDPLAPKKPTTAYMYYSKDKRAEYKAKHEGIGFGDLSSKIAAAWKTVTDEEKKKFIKLHEADKERYKKEMENYAANKPDSSSEEESDSESSDDKKKKGKGKAKKAKAKRDPNLPKAAQNPFLCFQRDKREQIKKDNPSLKTIADMSKKLGEIWRGMSPEEKKVYVDQAAKDKKRFEKEKAEYDKTHEKKPKS